MVDDYGLKLLRWVRERGVRQKLLIEKGSCVGWEEANTERGRRRGKGRAHCLASMA